MPVQRARSALRDRKATQAPLDRPAQRVTKVIRARRDRKDRREHQALKDRPDRTVSVDW